MQIAATTDHSFTTPDIERAIIEPLGCSVISQQAFTDQHALIELVRDADYVITQFAPVNAGVIDCMQKRTIIVLRTSVATTVAAAIRDEKLPNVVNGVGAKEEA